MQCIFDGISRYCMMMTDTQCSIFNVPLNIQNHTQQQQNTFEDGKTDTQNNDLHPECTLYILTIHFTPEKEKRKREREQINSTESDVNLLLQY